MLTYLSDAIAACEQSLIHSSDSLDSLDSLDSIDRSAFASACRTLGNLLQGMGKFEDAVIWHTQALDPQPDVVTVYTRLGQLYVQQQNWQRAIALYETLLKLKPDDAGAYWHLGEALSRSGKPTEALNYWYQALRLQPEQATAEGYCSLANLLCHSGESEKAIACYHHALKQDGCHAAAYHNLGELLTVQGDWAGAIACYQQAVAQVAEPGWAYYKLGDVWLKQGQWADAVTAFRAAIEHDPAFPWSYHNLLEALMQLQQWDEVIAVARSTIALERGYAWAHTYLGRALVQQGAMQEAIACHQQACALRGWPQCLEREYQFIHDWFSHNIPIWEHHLKSLAHRADVNILEIGSYQGMSACWFLDQVLTHPTASLTCIDPNFQPQFQANLAKTGAVSQVKPLVGSSHDWLPTLAPEFYDVIYIDGCHLANHVKQDALLSWKLLKVGGLLIFDDYEWVDPNYPGEDPKLGIDAFMTAFQPHIEVLHKAYQVIVKKVSLPEA